MILELTRVIIDFGLVVLIWMVQLIIYPSFKYYQNEDLQRWHTKYTGRIAVVVVPLMFVQLFIYGYALFKVQGIFEITGSLIVLLMWIITFSTFVPLHNAITSGNYNQQTLDQLIKFNWIRTVFWSGLFSISIWNYL
ncbi:MAG: hypothetical protein HRU26_17410 [Psychroserpens sp.]|nr:hypothetical protein [Psychroserpens sp.]